MYIYIYIFNPLTQNDIYIANSVSKFGGILVAPIRLTAVARYA